MEEDEVLSLSPDSYSTERVRETRADRIKNSIYAPDFTPTRLQTDKDILSESVMHMSDTERQDILRSTGVYASTGQQTATAIENALIGMNQLGDELTISFGNIANYITGGAMGKELQDIAYDSMARRYERMANSEEAIGGIRSELAQLAGGATSFLQLALEGLATGGYLSLAHIGAQSFGEGTYNDMKAYADKHDGSLEGYKPQGVDLAINTANAIMQVATEEILGVGRVGFIKSAAMRGGIKEGLGGAVQEGVQSALADLAEAMKGNEEYSILLDNIDQYVRDAIIGGVLQGSMGAATYQHSHAKATNNLSNAIAKARGHETPTAEDKQQADAIIGANERGYASAFVQEFKAAFDAASGEGKLQANIAKAINDAIKAKELDLGIDDETERAQRVEQIATQETINAMEQANEQGKSISEMGINNIIYKDGSIYIEGYNPEIGDMAVDRAKVIADRARIRAERQTGLAELNDKIDATNREIEQIKKDLAEAKAQSKQALAEKLQARLDKQTKIAEKRRLDAEKLKKQTAKIETQIAKRLSKESAELAAAAKSTENLAEKQKTPNQKQKTPESAASSEQKPLANVSEKLQKTEQPAKSLKAERTGQLKEQNIERYDPKKQYKKYDVVKVRTNSGEHYGVWDGSRMGLFDSLKDVQSFIENNKRIEENNRRYQEEQAAKAKADQEAKERGLRVGQGLVPMDYIIDQLKAYGMWDGLSLREKGNFNAIGSVYFQDGKIVNAWGNENSKKGTKVTDNTLNTIDELRNKINEQNQEVADEEQLLHQPTLDNQKNGTIIGAQGGEDARQKQRATIRRIRQSIHSGNDAEVWSDTSTGDKAPGTTKGVRNLSFNEKTKQELKDSGLPAPSFTVYTDAKVGAQDFLNAMEKSVAELGEKAASVDVKELSDYEDMAALILSEDKKTGCAITKDGDIVSLFSSSTERHRTIPMLLVAIKEGGKKLDCFDIYLPDLYSRVGFKAIARNNWVEKYKPNGWNKELFAPYNNGEPDVVFMVYDPNNMTEYNRGDGKLIKSGDVDADYGLGMQAQDEALADIAFQQAQGFKHMMFPGNQMLHQEELEETDELLHQESVQDGLTTTNSTQGVLRKIQGLKNGGALRLLYDTESKEWYLADANETTHIDMFVKAVEQGNYPELGTQREAERFFNENYIADEQTLLSFFAQRFDSQETAKVVMENVLGSDEYTNAYFDGNTVIYARNEFDLEDAGMPIRSFDHYKLTYTADGERKVELVSKRATSDNALNQSKVEGTGSDKYRGGYDEKLKRIVLSDKSDLTTIQHEFAHYWMQNNFKWARSGLASEDWLRRWRGVEEALGIEPEDRFLSRQASEKFARAYEQYIMEGKYNEDLGWLFNGFQKFYQQVYEGLENDYFDLSEELDPKIVDWFNRQRPVTEQALKKKAYQKVAMTAMAQGVEVAQKVNDDTYTVSSMDKNGEIKTEVVMSDAATKDSKLVEYSGKKKERSMVKGLQQVNKDINPDMYKAVNNAATVENATRWVETDYAGAWNALNDPSTALIDRTALYQAFKGYAENGHPEVAVDLAQIKLTKEMTELGQAMSILSERAEFDPMNIMDLAQKALGEPKAEDAAEEITGMHVEQEQNVMTEAQTNELKNQTECKL